MPRPDWRKAGEKQLATCRESLVALRRNCIAGSVFRPLYMDGRCFSAAQINDARLELLAQRECERSMQRAIHEWNEAADRQKQRAGEAL